MLRAVLCCVLIAATAAMAWESLDPVPSPAEVGAGSHITWGDGGIWGMFPTNDPEDPATYVGFYDPGVTDWELLEEPMEWEYLEYTGLTYQWLEDGVLFGVGSCDGDPYLYWYSLHDNEWDYDDLPFNLGNGACIAYQPNVNYSVQMNPVPGWIYCLPGQSTDFWRYAIPTSLPNVALDGIYPGQGAVIADQTPLFQWGNTAQPQYRLLVSTNSLFSDTVLDRITTNPEYQDSSLLTNGTYYWRSAAWVSSAWSWSLTHDFELDGGWTELVNDDIPHSVNYGAAMAYDGDAFGHQSIFVLVGGGHKESYEYNIVGQQGQRWNQEEDAPVDVIEGTSLTTHDATEGSGLFPWTALGGSTTSDNPWYYVHAEPDWYEWHNHSPDPYYHSHFPTSLGPGASMAYGTNNNQYLIVGEDGEGNPRNNFYWVDPPSAIMDGSQTGAARAGGARTQVIARYDAVEVEYQLPASARVRATLHDAVGRQVGYLDAGEQKPGVHRLVWDRDSEGRRLSAGAYFVLLDTGTEQSRLKAMVR
jgi:hypothetical protein